VTDNRSLADRWRDPANPQSWNRYSYVLNDAVDLLDPIGLTVCDATGNNCYDSVTVTAGGGGGRGGGTGVSGGGTGVSGGGTDDPGSLILMGGRGGAGGWWGTFLKTLFTKPTTGPASCIALFKDTATAPLKQVATAAQKYVPLIISATQATPPAAAWYVQQVNNMISAGAADASEAAPALALVTTVGAAAADAAPYVSQAAPYVLVGGVDLSLVNGLTTELKAGLSGQCHW